MTSLMYLNLHMLYVEVKVCRSVNCCDYLVIYIETVCDKVLEGDKLQHVTSAQVNKMFSDEIIHWVAL